MTQQEESAKLRQILDDCEDLIADGYYSGEEIIERITELLEP